VYANLRRENDKDAFWLAQVHFSTGNYTRAQSFLSKQNLIARNPSCRYLAGHCLIKQGRFEEALSVLGEKNPTHLITTVSNRRRKLQHTGGHGRAASLHGKGISRADTHDRRDEVAQDEAANVRFEAAMCFLRGLCYAKQNAFDRAKECYKDAVRIDVQCFEAFEQLMKNCLMSPDEEWEFLDSLDFDAISITDDTSSSQEAAEFTKMLYTTRLSKYKNPTAFTAATETLITTLPQIQIFSFQKPTSSLHNADSRMHWRSRILFFKRTSTTSAYTHFILHACTSFSSKMHCSSFLMTWQTTTLKNPAHG